MTTLEEYEFKNQIEKLKSYRGNATELISLYIPPTRHIADVTNYLRNEYALSSNIKSKTTRKNVMSAIDSILNKLKYFRKPPEKGIVVFAGYYSIGAKEDFVLTLIEPLLPITTFLYRCDDAFYLSILEDMLAYKDEYGLVVIDRKEATVGLLRGKHIEIIKNFQSLVPSKHCKGGQSQKRFERLIEIAAHEYFTKISDFINTTLPKNIKGILFGGPGFTKQFFVERYLSNELKNKVVGVVDCGYTDEYGIKELVTKAEPYLAKHEIMQEKKVLADFMKKIMNDENAIYGENVVHEALVKGKVDTLILSENLKLHGNCITELCMLAKESDAKIEFVSDETSEGNIFFRAFSGIGAILRYR